LRESEKLSLFLSRGSGLIESKITSLLIIRRGKAISGIKIQKTKVDSSSLRNIHHSIDMLCRNRKNEPTRRARLSSAV
jgi:hypothetical protein